MLNLYSAQLLTPVIPCFFGTYLVCIWFISNTLSPLIYRYFKHTNTIGVLRIFIAVLR